MGIIDGAGEDSGVAGRNTLHRTRRGRGRGKFFQNGIQQATTDGFRQNVRDAAQESFLFPVRRMIRRVSDERCLGIATAEAFDAPDAFHAEQIRIQHAGRDEAVNQQRLGVFKVRAVDDPVIISRQRHADGFREVGMG